MGELNQCRVCLAERSDLEPIFNNDNSIALDIYLICGVKIVEIHNQTKAFICKRCIADLSVAKEFRTRCRNSEESLKNSLQNVEKVFWNGQDLEIKDQNLLDITFRPDDELKQIIKVEPDLDYLSEEEEENYAWNYDEFEDTAQSSSEYNEIVLDPESLRTLTCPHCGKKLNSRRTLKYHIQVKHEPQSSRKYKCQYCDKAFPNKHPLKRHVIQSHSSVPSKYVKKNETDILCDICKVVLKNKKSYRNHVRNKHPLLLDVIFPKIEKKDQMMDSAETEDPSFPCAICGKIFKNKGNLAQHEKTHRVLLPHEYWYCDLCGNKFKEKLLMQIHIRKRHIQKIRYQCEQCTCSYTTNYYLKNHIKVRHQNIKEWICNTCGKAFGDKQKLIAHERIHTGEQPYQCRYCEAKFTHQTDYRRHVWNHEGRKGFKCQKCGEGFVRRSELISHKNRCNAFNAQPQFPILPQHFMPLN